MAKTKTAPKKQETSTPKAEKVVIEDKRPVIVQELNDGKWIEIDECEEKSCRKAKKAIRANKNESVQREITNPRRRIRRKGKIR